MNWKCRQAFHQHLPRLIPMHQRNVMDLILATSRRQQKKHRLKQIRIEQLTSAGPRASTTCTGESPQAATNPSVAGMPRDVNSRLTQLRNISSSWSHLSNFHLVNVADSVVALISSAIATLRWRPLRQTTRSTDLSAFCRHLPTLHKILLQGIFLRTSGFIRLWHTWMNFKLLHWFLMQMKAQGGQRCCS